MNNTEKELKKLAKEFQKYRRQQHELQGQREAAPGKGNPTRVVALLANIKGQLKILDELAEKVTGHKVKPYKSKTRKLAPVKPLYDAINEFMVGVFTHNADLEEFGVTGALQLKQLLFDRFHIQYEVEAVQEKLDAASEPMENGYIFKRSDFYIPAEPAQ